MWLDRNRSWKGKVTGAAVLLSLSAVSMGQGRGTDVHDLTWEKLSADFYDAPFFGDGVQGGTLLSDEQDGSAARILLGHYKAITYSGVPKWEYCDSRVYAASIIAKPFGAIEKIGAQTEISRGRVQARFQSKGDTATLTVFADRTHHVTVAVLESTSALADSVLSVRPEWGVSAKYHLEKPPMAVPPELVPPKPDVSTRDGMQLVLNRMAKRGGHTVASKLVRLSPKKVALICAIGTDDHLNPAEAVVRAEKDAISRLSLALRAGVARLERDQDRWWAKYWSNSSISLPADPYWEKFWYLNLYKFASASSQSSPLVIDTCGPWIWKSGWAAIWWNLNVQLSYYPMYSSNQLDAGRSLWLGVKQLFDTGVLHKNAEGKPGIHIGRSTSYLGRGSWGTELGNLPWVLHCLWKYWRYSGDDEMGRQLLPMLVESLRYQETFFERGVDGKLHMSASRSPEYKDGEFFYRDANYALSGVYWMIEALEQMQRELGVELSDREHWEVVGRSLAPMPTNEHGLMIGADQGFDESHRHYSHLLAIYPYHLINPRNGTKSRELVRKSLERWLTLKGGHAGYTFTGGSAMYSALGEGDSALNVLNLLKPRLTPNTMYAEGSPVVETPLSAVESINYMLLQSWDGVVRVFPAVPSKWSDASFRNLRAEGGFLVSAALDGGRLKSITLKSERGGPVKLQAAWGDRRVKVALGSGHAIQVKRTDETLSFHTSAGQTYFISLAEGSL